MNETFFSKLLRAVSFLAGRRVQAFSVPVRKTSAARKLFFYAYAVSFLALSRQAVALTTVAPSSAAPVGIEEEFITDATNAYNIRLLKNPLASHTYTMTIFSKNPHQQLGGDALTDCIAQGFTDGMDAERSASLELIHAMQNRDIINGTCADLVVSTDSVRACQTIYNTIGNAIAQRWMQVYTSTGGVVTP